MHIIYEYYTHNVVINIPQFNKEQKNNVHKDKWRTYFLHSSCEKECSSREDVWSSIEIETNINTILQTEQEFLDIVEKWRPEGV